MRTSIKVVAATLLKKLLLLFSISHEELRQKRLNQRRNHIENVSYHARAWSSLRAPRLGRRRHHTSTVVRASPKCNLPLYENVTTVMKMVTIVTPITTTPSSNSSLGRRRHHTSTVVRASPKCNLPLYENVTTVMKMVTIVTPITTTPSSNSSLRDQNDGCTKV